MTKVTEQNLKQLNSLTKYPSIPTYHSLGERGSLKDEHILFGTDEIIATEKVDGTNSRIIFLPDGRYLIGSREELLHASGDLIFNPAMGIVPTLRPIADQLVKRMTSKQGEVTTIYFETYGGKTTAAAKQYTSDATLAVRMFDICTVEISRLEMPVQEIALWRENGGQDFFDEARLQNVAKAMELPLTPRIPLQSELPTEIESTLNWLQAHISKTLVALDQKAGGQPEGLVIRTPDRRKIAKVRYDDYRRHMRRKGKTQ